MLIYPLENRLDSANRRKGRIRRCVFVPTAPTIVGDVGDYFCLDRVLVDISHQHHKIGQVIYWFTLEPVLKQVTIPRVLPVEVIRIRYGNPLGG